MSKYWTQEDRDLVNTAKSYNELFFIAQNVLARMPRPRVQVCGPISTGGAGTLEKNLERFDRAINYLRTQGIEPFDQLPFEEKMKILKEGLNDSKSFKLLNDFYLPIFENKLVDELHFLPDWQSSIGASWEHEQGTRLGLRIMYLDIFF